MRKCDCCIEGVSMDAGCSEKEARAFGGLIR